MYLLYIVRQRVRLLQTAGQGGGVVNDSEHHLEYTAESRRQGSLICARTAGSAGKQPSGCQQPGKCVGERGLYTPTGGTEQGFAISLWV